MKKLITLISFAATICSQAAAQTEFFVSVDPLSGKVDKISALQDVKWINYGINAYSQSSHRFYFSGSDADVNQWFFYTIDAANGSVVSKTLFPAGLSNIFATVYNENDGRVYAISRDAQTSKIDLLSIDPSNLSFSTVCNLPNAVACGSHATIDGTHNRYICTATDSNNVESSYVIDLSVGAVISAKPLPADVTFMKFDEEAGLFYGLGRKINGQEWSLVSFEPMNNVYSVVRPMTETNSIVGAAFTYDKAHKNYYCLTYNNGDERPFLVSINTIDGSSPNKPLDFSHVAGNKENLLHWNYDPSMKRIFALHWEATAMDHVVRFSPNPMSSSATLSLGDIYTSASVVLVAADGRVVRKNELTNAKTIVIDKNDLAPGVYIMKVYGDGKFLSTEKVVIE